MDGTRPTRDTGNIVMGWLTKVAVVLAIVGLCLFDAIAVGTRYTATSDAGHNAARAGSEAWFDSKDVQIAYSAALTAATMDGADYTIDPKTFVVDADGTVHLKISSDAETLIIKRLGPIKKWAHVEREASARYLL